MKNLLIGAALVTAVLLLAWKATQTGKPRPAHQAPLDSRLPQAAPAPESAEPDPSRERPAFPAQAPGVNPSPVAEAPASPAVPARTGRTELGTLREDCLYLCDKCGKAFSPTRESMQDQVNVQWTDAIDCPYCDGHRTAHFARTCPSCLKVFAQLVRDPKTGEVRPICPQCGTDPIRWELSIKKARSTSPPGTGATDLGPRREDFRFLCRKCGSDFSPTPESAQKQTRGQGKSAIDCPLCYGRSCAELAVCCPKCKHVYLTAAAAKAICPRCKTDAVEWHRAKDGAK